jgi:hypothetical protein
MFLQASNFNFPHSLTYRVKALKLCRYFRDTKMFKVTTQIKRPANTESLINLKRINVSKGKGKSKAIPLQAWTGPEGSRRLRLPNLKTIGTLTL